MKIISGHTLGIINAIAGFTCWILSGACLKYAGESPMPKYEITALMSISALCAVVMITALRGKTRNLRPQKISRHIILGLILLTDILATLVAVKYLPLMNVYVIMFLTPILTALVAPIFLNERTNAFEMLMIIAGFLGVVIAIDPAQAGTEGSWIGYAGAFLCLGTSTANTILLRHYRDAESRESMAFYPRIVVAIATFLACAFWTTEPIGARELIAATSAGFFAGTGWLFMTIAFHKVPAPTVAPYRYTQIVSAAILGYLVWGDVPKLNLIIGSIIIIASGIALARRTRAPATETSLP